MKILLNKLKRFLGITKPIILSSEQIRLVKLIKGHYKDKHVSANDWVETLKPLFNEIYGWNADEHYRDYLNCIFNQLTNIFLTIHQDYSGDNLQIKKVIESTFDKSRRDYDLPIERAIAELCGQIQCTKVKEYGVERFSLNEPMR